MRTANGILLAAIALALGGLGIWTMATKDVQGGRHEAGVLIRVAAGLVFLALGGLLGLYGAFAILYREHGGGNTYVTLGGHQIDADLAGVIALLLGSLLILIAITFLRRERRSPNPPRPIA